MILCRCAFLVIVLGAVAAVGGCATLAGLEERPQVSLSNIQPLDMTLFEQRYRLNLRVQNPNREPLPIEGMSYRVYLNGRKFATGVSNQRVDVPAFGEAMVDVDVVSNLLRLVEQARALESTQTPNLDWRIEGSLALRGFVTRIPFDYSGSVDLSSPEPTGPGSR